MTMPAPRLVRLPAADQDRRALPQGRPAVDETLVAARRPAANYTDRLKLVDDLGDGEEGRCRAGRPARPLPSNPPARLPRCRRRACSPCTTRRIGHPDAT